MADQAASDTSVVDAAAAAVVATPDATKTDTSAAAPDATKADATKVEAAITPEAKAAADKAIADAKAPEKYEAFTLPEGVERNPEATAKFEAIAKELNLTQAQAQKLVDLNAEALKTVPEKLKAQHAERVAKWGADAVADKEFGGEKLAENLARAERALDTVATPEFKAFLTTSGLSHHPEMIRTMLRVAAVVGEDKLVPASKQPAGSGDSVAKGLYTNSPNLK
ncbi:putative protease [uncultured Caudovirales phage]|uniref:Putative protease n=1 Tax=uncultured Caudovirales phage TaxID=2100421 RepID=A0A6J5S2U0_9CAUD|nr:putative protease [uncultured Caudovirales phage]CAB4212955.1 putative protease [uncultured Caudovirales phage]